MWERGCATVVRVCGHNDQVGETFLKITNIPELKTNVLWEFKKFLLTPSRKNMIMFQGQKVWLLTLSLNEYCIMFIRCVNSTLFCSTFSSLACHTLSRCYKLDACPALYHFTTGLKLTHMDGEDHFLISNFLAVGFEWEWVLHPALVQVGHFN